MKSLGRKLITKRHYFLFSWFSRFNISSALTSYLHVTLYLPWTDFWPIMDMVSDQLWTWFHSTTYPSRLECCNKWCWCRTSLKRQTHSREFDAWVKFCISKGMEVWNFYTLRYAITNYLWAWQPNVSLKMMKSRVGPWNEARYKQQS